MIETTLQSLEALIEAKPDDLGVLCSAVPSPDVPGIGGGGEGARS